MKNLLINFSLFFFLLLIQPQFFNYSQSTNLPQLQPPEEYNCVIFEGYNYDSLGQMGMSFYNACNERLWINACVKESSSNKFTLRKSFQHVPVGGRLNIFVFPGTYPEALQWTAAPFNPPVPPACLKKSPFAWLDSPIGFHKISTEEYR